MIRKRVIIDLIRSLAKDTQHRNSFFLLGSYGLMSLIGFAFWIVVARLYSPEKVGTATTLISVSSLLTTISLLGTNNAVVRFFRNSPRKVNFYSTVIVLVSLASVLSALVFIGGLPFFSSKMTADFQSVSTRFLFTLFILIFAINTITDSFFISLKKTHNILIINFISSFIKMFIPIFLVGAGALGVFGSFVIAICIASGLSLFILYRNDGLVVKPILDKSILKEIFAFSSSQFLSSLFGFLPSSIIPILITNRFGSSFSAYFYMPNLIYAMLISVPRSITLSMYAEGSSDEKNSGKHAWKALRSTYIILIPLVLLAILLAAPVLKLFGKSYASEGLLYLQLVLFSSLLTPVFYVLSTLLNVRKKNAAIVSTYLFISLAQIVINYAFLPYGLNGLGVASVVNQIVISVAFTVAYWKFCR